MFFIHFQNDNFEKTKAVEIITDRAVTDRNYKN